MDSTANDGVESSAESPEAEECHQAVSKNSPAATKGRRWRRIRREQQKQQREAYAAAGSGSGASGDGSGGRGDEDSVQQHKRRLPVLAGAPKVKHETVLVEEESSTASVESRFIPQAPANLDSGLGFLVEFSIGADSDNSKNRSSRSSTAASAPHVFPRHGHDTMLQLLPLERDRPRSRGLAASLHSKHPRAGRRRVHAAAGSTVAEISRSSVESGRRSSNTSKARHLGVGVAGDGIQKALCADHSSEGQPSEDLRSTATGGYYKENGSNKPGKLARTSADPDDDVLNGQNGGLHSGSDPYAESVLLLQRTQEALENEIEKIVSLGEEVPNDEFDIYDDKRGDSVHLKEPIQEGSGTIKHQDQSRLEEVPTLIKDKDSRTPELGADGRMQPGEEAETESTNTNLLLSQSELDELYQSKTEAEVQCIILTRACCQTLLTTPADDQTVSIYEAQKSLSEEYRQLGLEQRHAESRAMVLEKRAEKVQMQCEEMSRSSEVLQLRCKATRVSLFCFVQFVLMCIAVGTCLLQLVLPSSTEVVPT